MAGFVAVLIFGLCLPLLVLGWLSIMAKRDERRYREAQERYDRQAERLVFEASMRGEVYIPQPFMWDGK